jgi:hypothetical protein
MKNKLLLSSALVGSLAITGVASAQTTISGSLDLSYKTISNSGTRTKETDTGFGRESQINIANKGKLSNGMDYAAGFSLEFDGKSGASTGDATSATTAGAATQSNIQRLSRENIFIDVISGTTTLSVGMDHLNNMSFSSAPRVAQNASTTAANAQLVTASTGDVAASDTSGGVAYQFYPGATSLGASNYMGIGVQQVTPFGTITGQYFPRATAQQAGNDGVARANAADAYELHYRGDLGVKGLNANVGYNVVTSASPSTTQNEKQKGIAYGLGYNFGQFAIGAQRTKTDNGVVGASTAKIDTKATELGATFAATKDISLGITHVKTEGTFRATTAMAADEKIVSGTIGYNLGAVTLSATYAEIQDARGVSGNDSDIVLVRAGTRF